ncbi:hypothetical protein QE369_003002 [Agrobacterium larrymoorei]|uniref:DUF2793 domain-containing protein n=1 Tax=Agrobacterium larrymoorei TaxID=160699 RepID=A0AAJ2ES46_9HYPH|nr:DUF2793 domain-containing protein [Agrobacterium larrymoorei]MDR6102805.1 hypothetical protein [Agrobacterium larrymoorei]
MDRINGQDTIDIGGGRRGFRAENLVAGLAGTEVTADFLNGIQEEILKVVLEAGLAPNAADWSQLWQALKLLGLSSGSKNRRWTAVTSMSVTAPPANPATGDTYLIPAGASGAWAGNIGKIADWTGDAWSYFSPPDGHGVGLPDGRLFLRVGGAFVEKVALDAQSGKWNFAVAAGTANAVTATLTPAPAAYVDGMQFRLKALATNTSVTPTMSLNGLPAKQILNGDGSWLTPGSIVAGVAQNYSYDATLDKIILVTPANTGVKQGSGWIRHSDGTYEAWGNVSFPGATTQVDVTLPVTFPVSIDSVLIADSGSGVFPGAGWPLSNSQIRCWTPKYVISLDSANVIAKSSLANPIVLWYRCWGR